MINLAAWLIFLRRRAVQGLPPPPSPPPPPPPPPPAPTMESEGLLGINTPMLVSYNPSRPYANLVNQARLIDNFADNDLPPLKANGYPQAGEDCYFIFAEDQLGADYSGTYAFSVDGNNVPTYASTGSLAGVSYSAGTNKTSGNITGVNGASNLVLGFTNVSADFDNLALMQPGFSVGADTFTPAFVTHAGRTTVLRAMDLATTNLVEDVEWTGSQAEGSGRVLDRPRSVVGCMEMAAAVGAQPWLNTSPAGSQDYLETFAETALALLPDDQVLTLELGNEPWNSASFSGFKAYPLLLRDSIVASEQFNGYANAMANPAGRRILSISRSGDEVTVTLDGNHGKTAGQTIYADVGGAFTAAGTKTLIAGTSGMVLKWTEAGTGGSGTINTGGLGDFVYLNPSNSLVTPLVSVLAPTSGGAVPTPLQVKAHYQIQRLKIMHDAAVAAGSGADVRLCFGMQTISHPDDIIGLARAVQQYGNLDWLDINGGGAALNYYLEPAAPADMVDADEVFAQLEASRASIAGFLVQTVNELRRYGLCKTPGRQLVYEYGQHCHIAPNGTVGAAIQEANRDDARMGTLLTNLQADMRDRGVGIACFFTSGSSKDYSANPTESGSAWGLREGVVAASPAQVKDTWFSAAGAVLATPQPISGKTWGTINIKEAVWGSHGLTPGAFQGGPGNAIYVVDLNYQVPDVFILICAPASATYTIALDACGWFTLGDTIAMEIDDAEVVSAAVPQLDYNSNLPGEMMQAVVALSAGFHWVRLRLSAAPRTMYNALYRLRCF